MLELSKGDCFRVEEGVVVKDPHGTHEVVKVHGGIGIHGGRLVWVRDRTTHFNCTDEIDPETAVVLYSNYYDE